MLNDTDCLSFFRKNAVFLEVNFAQLSYEMLEETPVTSFLTLFNNLAGNTGLWIGFSAITLAEGGLVFAQIFVWLFTKDKEIPDVPSCRRYNFAKNDDDNEENDENKKDIDGMNSPYFDSILNGNDLRHRSQLIFQ